jgi:3-oxoacyl-[acyl-carrier-protein] synthase-3
LARELGIEKTQTLLLNEGCASGVTGLGMIAGQMAIQPDLNTALFVAVNRVSEFHRNRMNVNNAVHSDGAVATVLRRGHDQLRWLATAQFTDPDLCDFFRCDFGGAVTPQPPADWSTANAPSGLERVLSHSNKDPNRLREFSEKLMNRVTEVITLACQQAGVSPERLAHIIYINDSADTIEEVAAPFGVTVEHTNAEVSLRHGHMGAADQLISLGEALQRGDIKSGDLVAMSGISIGMRWYCTLVQV